MAGIRLRSGCGLGSLTYPGSADDTAYALDFYEEAAELGQVGCFQRNKYRDTAVAVIGQTDGNDVNFFLGDQGGDIAHQTYSIVGLNLNLDWI